MKYIGTSDTFEGTIAWDFNSDNYLVVLEINAQLNEKQYHWLSTSCPMTLDDLMKLQATSKLKIAEVPEDLSFARFWEEFGNKVGNKAKIEKQFEQLSTAIKMKVFKAIPRYHRYLTVTGYAQAMASTWLAQERWDNEYSTKAPNQR